MHEKINDYDELMIKNKKIMDQERIKKVEAINKLAEVRNSHHFTLNVIVS